MHEIIFIFLDTSRISEVFSPSFYPVRSISMSYFLPNSYPYLHPGSVSFICAARNRIAMSCRVSNLFLCIFRRFNQLLTSFTTTEQDMANVLLVKQMIFVIICEFVRLYAICIHKHQNVLRMDLCRN